MKIEIEVPFSEAQKAQIVSRSEQIPTGRLVFEMSNKYAAVFPELSIAKYTVHDDVIQFVTGGVSLNYQTKRLEITISEKFAIGELKQGDRIDQIMQEFADLIEAEKAKSARNLRERAEADKLHEYMAPVRKWEEYNSRKIRKIKSRELAIQDAAKQAIQDKLEFQKLTWIEQHGSLRLKKGIELGHNCQKLYVIERSKSIIGEDYVLDYDGDVEIKDRSCPSLAGLEEVEAQNFRNHPEIKQVRVVWLPDGLSKLDHDYAESYEAVEVTLNDLKGYWYRTFD